jgi:hypothetical protein
VGGTGCRCKVVQHSCAVPAPAAECEPQRNGVRYQGRCLSREHCSPAETAPLSVEVRRAKHVAVVALLPQLALLGLWLTFARVLSGFREKTRVSDSRLGCFTADVRAAISAWLSWFSDEKKCLPHTVGAHGRILRMPLQGWTKESPAEGSWRSVLSAVAAEGKSPGMRANTRGARSAPQRNGRMPGRL